MRRRTYLGLAVATGSQLAGCTFSRSDRGGDGDEQDTPEDTGSEQTEFGPVSPTEADLVRGYISAAQAHLQTAVDQLVLQGNSFGSLDGSGQGPPVVARVDSISVEQVRDTLAAVRGNTRRVRELERESDESYEGATIASRIELVTNWLGFVLDAYPMLHELYLETHYLVRDFISGGVTADVQPVRAAASEATPHVEQVVETTDNIGRRPHEQRNRPVPESVDAVTWEGVEFQTGKLVAELSAGRSVADAVEALKAGDEIFWPARAAYPGVEGEPPEIGTFEAAAAEYSEAFAAATVTPASMREATNFCECYSRELSFAARRYTTANEYHKFGAPSDESESEYVADAESAIENANDCRFHWSE